MGPKEEVTDLLLVNSPWVHTTDRYAVKAGARWPSIRSRTKTLQYYPFPFFMAYAGALAKREGIRTWVYDAIAENDSPETCYRRVVERQPRLVVIETSTPSIAIDLAFAKRVREATGAVIALAGPHATARPDEVLQGTAADAVLFGEYDDTLLELAQKVLGGESLDAPLPGAALKLADGTLLNAGHRSLRKDIDFYPWPERDDLPALRYTDPTCKRYPNAVMVASRGCPYTCIFCVEPSVYYGKPSLRLRDSVNVVDEMEDLMDRYKMEEIYFDDATFTVNQKHARSIAEEMLRRKRRFYWSVMGDAKTSWETLKLMKEAGCAGIKFGIESANKDILEAIRKPFTPEQVEEFVANCRKLGIYTHGTFMFGLPGETRESVLQTLEFVERVNPTTSQFAIATPIPGTDFFRMAEENGWLTTKDWSQYEGGNSPVIEYPNLSRAEIQQFIDQAKRRKMVRLLTDPRVVLQYLRKIRRTEGTWGLIKDMGRKGRYVLAGR